MSGKKDYDNYMFMTITSYIVVAVIIIILVVYDNYTYTVLLFLKTLWKESRIKS